MTTAAAVRKTHYRACHLCEAICGVVIETEGQQILSIKGDKNDPLSRGHICPKATALKDLHEDPDRLRKPLRRVTDEAGESQWLEISWEEALDRAANGLMAVHQKHGVHAIGIYLGNPTVHNYGMMTHQGNLFRHLRTNNRFSATSVDQLPHHLAALWLFGHKTMFPIPDIDRSDYFLMLGANPIASNGSIWTVPDVKKRIKALKARGGKLVLLDPRRTETAQLASEHFFIKPGTDALFLLALLNTIFSEELDEPAHLRDFTAGLAEVRHAIKDFTPEYAAQYTGIDTATIQRIAREFAAANAAICYGRMGVSTQAYGTLSQWLIQIINIATGNLDLPGGSLFTLPALDQMSNISPGGFGRHHSRVRGLPEFDRELPSVALAEEITTPGEDQIRALFTGAGNPVMSTPNGRQLDEALSQLQFMVSLDPYLNETTRHADIILPPTSALEHDHYDIAFHGNAMRNTARFNEAVFDKPEGALHDWEIFTELGNRVAVLLGTETQPAVAPIETIALGLQYGPYAEQGMSLEKLRQHPSGVDLGPLQPQLPGRLRTKGKIIRCDTPEPLADLARLRGEFPAINATTDTTTNAVVDDCNELQPLQLIGRRHVRSNNSWMHNYWRLVKGKNRCTLLMHPTDLQQRKIENNTVVCVRSRVGELQVVVESSNDIMPGVVSLPHGYGHDRKGIRMAIAQRHAGVSCNDITDELALDTLSGNAAVNGVSVHILPA